MTDKLILTMDECLDDMRELANKIRNTVGTFECLVVGEPRGGLPVAVVLSHLLKCKMTSRQMATSEYIISQRPKVLVWCDDVIETGTTSSQAYQHLRMPVDHIRIDRFIRCCWIDKRWSPGTERQNDVWTQRYVDPQTWVVFPWEPIENVEKDKENFYAARQ